MKVQNLPIGGLPGQDQRGGQDSIGSLTRERSNGLLKTLESDASVFVGHAADQRTVGEESNVHGGEGEQGVHHIWGCGTYPEKTRDCLASTFVLMKSRFDIRGNMASPEGEVVRIDCSQLVVQGSNVIDQTEVLDGV
jgi:hypothetical protein